MSSASVSIRRCLSRHAVRRTAGIFVLTLFAYQTVAPVFAACGEAGFAIARGDRAMAHEHHGLPDRLPTKAPAPGHGSSCDHSVSGSTCCMAAGCATAIVGAPVVTIASRPAQLREIPASIERFLSPERAPDVPPPRA